MNDRPPVRASRTPTVVVVDGQELIRSAVTQALERDRLVVVGTADGAAAAMECVVELRPDVVLLDIDVPGGAGVELIERLTLLAPASHILILTDSEQNQVVEAIVAGATGYILKTAPPAAIAGAVRATAAGESVISPEIAGALLARIRAREIPVTVASDYSADAIRAVLTERELEIFTRIASGESNEAIGSALSLSRNTVANHVASILAKLQLDNRVQAAVQAVRSGIA